MAVFRKGDKVIQILPDPIVGEVDSFSVDQETGDVQIKVVWIDNDGVQHARFFVESEVEATPERLADSTTISV